MGSNFDEDFFMTTILCHGHRQQVEVFYIKPTKENIQIEKILYLRECNVCGNPVLEIQRVDIWGKILEPVRIKSKNIQKFMQDMTIIHKEKPQRIPQYKKASHWTYVDGMKSNKNVYDFNTDRKVKEFKSTIITTKIS